MTIEIDQGVAYVQFEKKLNIRSHIHPYSLWNIPRDGIAANRRPIDLTRLAILWSVELREGSLEKGNLWDFCTPSTLSATIDPDMSRDLFTHYPGCGSTCPIRSHGGNVSTSGAQRWGGDQVSGLNQVITQTCSFDKEEARAQEFVLNTLKVPFYVPCNTIWKCSHPFLTGQQSEVQPSSEQQRWEEVVCGGKGGLGCHNGKMQQFCLLEVNFNYTSASLFSCPQAALYWLITRHCWKTLL